MGLALRVGEGVHAQSPMVVRARAPLRVSFAGGGSDIVEFADQHGGAVFSTTINRFAYASLRKGGHSFRVDLPNLGISEVVDPDVASSSPVEFARRALGGAVNGFAGGLELFCDCPAGSGLGSSSALMVALVAARRRFLENEETLDPQQVAAEAYEVERERLGIKGGMQDQYAAAFGGFNFMRFLGRNQIEVEPVRISDAVLQELRYRMLLLSTRRFRSSARIISRQIAALGQKGSAVPRLLCEIRDLAYAARRALEGGSIDLFAQAIREGWELKRRVDPAIAGCGIDDLCQSFLAGGARAVKLLGAGGGGYILAIAESSGRAALERVIEDLGGTPETIDYEPCGVVAWEVNPSDEGHGGASVRPLAGARAGL
jgi:D-glycero-alpha-D-manno-heptose-7-phosphate kinase